MDGIFAQRFDASQTPQGTEFQVNSQTIGSQSSPAVAVDANGNFVVVWQSNANLSTADLNENIVCGQLYNSSGVPLGGEFRISSSSYLYDVFPGVAMDGAGNFTVTWESQDSGSYGVYSRRFNASGVAQGVETRITATGFDPDVATNRRGDTVISWIYNHNEINPTTGLRVYYHDAMARRFDANGSVTGNDLMVNVNRASNKYGTAVTVGQDGRFAVSWASSGQDGSSWGIYSRLYDALAQPQGGEFRINTYTQGAQVASSLSMTETGELVAVWASDLQDGDKLGIYAQRFSSDGTPKGNEIAISNYTLGNQFYPRVATDQSGNALVTWESDGQTGRFDVYGKLLANSYRAVANPDNATFDEDMGGPIAVLSNDSNPDGKPLTITDVSAAANGTTSIISGNTGTTGIYYTTKPNYHGPDSFTYTISNGYGGTSTATVNVTVNSVNDQPVASYQMFDGTEDVPQSFSLNASDVDNDPLVYTITQAPTNGTLSGTMPNLVYTPNPNYYGPEVIEFRVTDPSSAFADGRVTINLAAVRDPGLAIADTKTIAEDSDWTNINVMANDQDVDHVGISLWGITPTSQQGGSARIELDGTVSYKPAANFNGTDTFSYTIHDGYGLTSTTTVTVNVTPVNDAPVSSTQSVTTNEDTAKAITLSATDVEGDALTYSVVAPPTKGTLSGSGANLVYTPGANLNGSDSFTFKANDGKADSSPVAVNISVTPINDAPVAIQDAVSTPKNTVKTVVVTANDSDVDGDVLTVTSVTQGKNGSVALAGTGSVKYTPKRNYIGSDTFSYTISDGKGGTATATVAVTVTK